MKEAPDWIDGFIAATRLLGGQRAEYERMRDDYLASRAEPKDAQAVAKEGGEHD